MTGSRLVVAIAIAACACSHTAGESSVGGSPSRGGSAAVGTAPAVPSTDTSCAADADCELTNLQLSGDQTCCPVCGQLTPGRADWARAVRDVCAARSDWTVRCMPLSCPVGVDRAACKDGHCVIVQP
jgi:hypothetical protein